MTYAELSRRRPRRRARSRRAGRRTRRPGRDPVQHPRRVHRRRPGSEHRRRSRRAGVPVELGRRVRVGGRQLPESRRHLRERRPGGQDRRGSRQAPRPRARGHHGRHGAGHDDARRASGPRCGRRRVRARPANGRGLAGRWLPDHLHLGHDRAPQGRGAHEPWLRRWSRVRRAEMGLFGPGDSLYLYLPLAHMFAQICQAPRSRSAARSCSGAATRTRSSPSWARCDRPSSRRCRASSRRSTRSSMAFIPPERKEAAAAAVDLGVRVRDAALTGDGAHR